MSVRGAVHLLACVSPVQHWLDPSVEHCDFDAFMKTICLLCNFNGIAVGMAKQPNSTMISYVTECIYVELEHARDLKRTQSTSSCVCMCVCVCVCSWLAGYAIISNLTEILYQTLKKARNEWFIFTAEFWRENDHYSINERNRVRKRDKFMIFSLNTYSTQLLSIKFAVQM